LQAGDEATGSLRQLLTLRQPYDLQLSRDGERVAFAVVDRETTEGGLLRSSVWEGSVRGPLREVTCGPGTDLMPRFSPDGGRLAFASDRDHPGWVTAFILEADGEAKAVGSVSGAVEEIRWHHALNEIVVLSADLGSTSESLSRLDASASGPSDPEVRRPAEAWRRLFRVDVESGGTIEVSPDGLTVWEFSLHRDHAVALLSEDPGDGGWYDAWIGLVDLRTGAVERLYASEQQLACPRLSPDGGTVAWTENVCSDRGNVMGALTVLDLDSGETRVLARSADVAKLEWLEDGRLRVCGPRGLETYCGVVDPATGELRQADCGKARLGQLHLPDVTGDPTGRVIAAVREAPGRPPEVSLFETANRNSGWREISSLNQHLKSLPVPDMREVHWTSDGLDIEGILIVPSDGEPPYPMVVNVHGGPTALWEWSFSPGYAHSGLLFAESGFAVLLPNPRGSNGRGREFASANIGDLGGGDCRDILAGVDACVDMGLADGERVGLWGISYGGFMAAWMAATTTRFAAIVPVASHTNWLSFHNTTNIPSFDQLFVGPDPYDPAGGHFHRSPVVHARSARTPTLFLHGAVDRICPVSQAEEMYRALAEAGCETELVIYPREGHCDMWAEPDHALDGWKRLKGWMERFL
jgi:dipeptidyl aminopeptidase/acylaminoacyl peptidase